MKLKRVSFVLFMLLFVLKMQAQQVNENFPVQVFSDDFSSENNLWDYLTTAENLFVLDKGEYFMHRRNETKPYALVTNWKNDLTLFHIKAAVKLGPATSAEQTIGIIFYIQPDGKGALVFEINKDKKFRVKQLVGAYYKFLTGEVTDAGWVKSKFVDNTGEYNVLEVKSAGGINDFYINGNFVFSAPVQDYAPGALGILIGADTKAKADYFYVYATREVSSDVTANRQFGELTPNEKIEFLLAENDKLKKQIAQDNVDLIKQQADLKIATMLEQVNKKDAEIEQLKIEVNSLTTYKNSVIKDMDEDVFLTLSNSVKEQIEVNKKLNKFIEEIRDSLAIANKKYNDLKLKQVTDLIEQQKKEQAKKQAIPATKEEQKPETAKVQAKKEEAVKIADQPKVTASEKKVEAKPLSVKTRTAIKKG
ncbi:MAG: hypothetical protein POELPBGB_03018 [Bacteroidia bacterium]|nr:hypothetical protein [Bacteroidia bacterium]